MQKLTNQIRKMQKLISLMEGFNSDQLESFLRNENIEFNDISYLGEGENGIAYSLGNGRVFKITTSESERDIASQIKGKKLPGLVMIYDWGWYDDNKPKRYYIVMDELDTDSSIEDMLYRTELILSTQGLDISQINSFDDDGYDGSEGELDADILKFMNELNTIYRSCNNIGIRSPDINFGNLGYDSSGVLTAFDLQDRVAMRNKTW